MRIAVIGPAPPLRGGIAQHTAGLAEALTRGGHDVRVLSYARQYPGIFFPATSQRDDSEAVGEEILDVLSPATWTRVLERVSSQGIDRVVAQWWHPVAAPALQWILSRVRGPLRTVLCHNVLPHEWFPAANFGLERTLSRADEIVCHSEYVARDVRSRVAGMPVRVAPMPLLPRSAGLSADAIGELSRDPDVRQVLFCGNIRAYKGLDGLIDAWRRRDRRAPAALSICGDEYRRGLRGRRSLRLTSQDSDVRRESGYMSDSRLLLAVARADTLVLPYSRATQSGWIPIADALGTPVLASDVGGLREQARSGQDIEWVRPDDRDDLVAALNRQIGREPRSAAVRREALAAYAGARQESWRGVCEALTGEDPIRS